jgi:hypothetical protein
MSQSTCRPALFLSAAVGSWGVATAISKRALDEIASLTMPPTQLAVSVLVLTVGLCWTALTWSGHLACADSPRSACSTPASPTR